MMAAEAMRARQGRGQTVTLLPPLATPAIVPLRVTRSGAGVGWRMNGVCSAYIDTGTHGLLLCYYKAFTSSGQVKSSNLLNQNYNVGNITVQM